MTGECPTRRILTIGDDELILSAYDDATRIGCSLYDGLYLALADAAEGSLIYADGRLRNALAGRFARALWLGGYSPHRPFPGDTGR